ncbi:hypothetical protein RB601_004610 [Gaeumannomyces tritici]
MAPKKSKWEQPKKSDRPDATELVEMIRQTYSASDRTEGVRKFATHLRRGRLFAPAWAAVGGAPGLADIMAQLNLADIRVLCKMLGRTASVHGAMEERRAAMDELASLLYDSSQPRDKRPLQHFYRCILPACSVEVMVDIQKRYRIELANCQKKRLLFAHPRFAESSFLEEIFVSGDDSTLIRYQVLWRGNIPLCERVLTTLIDTAVPSVPSNFLTYFAVPFLRVTLGRRRHSDEERDRFLDLIMQGLDKDKKHTSQAPRVSISDGIVSYVVKRWHAAREGARTQALEAHLVRLLRLIDRDHPTTSINDLYRAVMAHKRMGPSSRHKLIRLFLLHIKIFRFDIEDPTQSARFALANKHDTWPPRLFLSIGNKSGLDLMEKLEALHPKDGFIGLERGNTVLGQSSHLGTARGDVEILRALLCRELKDGKSETSSRRLHSIVQERKKAAEQSREAPLRAFWALSVLNLSVAIGDLTLLHDSIIWARRFTKDATTIKEIFDVVETRELKDLLCALPNPDSADGAAHLAAALPLTQESTILLANQTVLALAQSAIMVASEGHVKSKRSSAKGSYTEVSSLPRDVYKARLHWLSSLQIRLKVGAVAVDLDQNMLDAVCKPTADLLLQLEKLRRSSGGAKLVFPGVHQRSFPSPMQLISDLARCRGAILAELVAYICSAVQDVHSPEDPDDHSYTTTVHSVISEVTKSDHPSLAWRLLRSAIAEGGSDNAWHWDYLTTPFISALPADMAKEFLHFMADSITGLMRKQKSLPWVQGQKPVIKVTTIKRMANVLRSNMFVDASSSCDMLISLLVEARHIDARIAIVESLARVMEDQTCPEELRARILDSLEQHVVPAAGALNPRRVLTEADWAQVGVPEVGEDAPLLDLLVCHARNPKLHKEDNERLMGLVMDVLRCSSTNNVRWMKAFLFSRHVTLGPDERLPICPANTQALLGIFKDLLQQIPLSVFRMVREVVLAKYTASATIRSVTKKVSSDRDLKDSNAGRHWLHHFGEDQDQGWSAVVHALLRRPADPEVTQPLGEVGVGQLQDLLLEFAEAQIRAGDRDGLYRLVENLSEQRFNGRDHYSVWKSNCLPLVRRIIAATESERATPTAGASSDRGQVLLLNTFRLKRAAIRIPFSRLDDPAPDEDLDAFAADVVELIEGDLAAPRRRVPYHEDVEDLCRTVCAPEVAQMSSNCIRFAKKLADVGGETASLGHPPLSAYLRLEMAVDALRSLSRISGKQREEVGDLVRYLQGCRNEGLVIKGYQLEDYMKEMHK